MPPLLEFQLRYWNLFKLLMAALMLLTGFMTYTEFITAVGSKAPLALYGPLGSLAYLIICALLSNLVLQSLLHWTIQNGRCRREYSKTLLQWQLIAIPLGALLTMLP